MLDNLGFWMALVTLGVAFVALPFVRKWTKEGAEKNKRLLFLAGKGQRIADPLFFLP